MMSFHFVDDDEDGAITQKLKEHPVFKSRPDPARMKKCANILQVLLLSNDGTFIFNLSIHWIFDCS